MDSKFLFAGRIQTVPLLTICIQCLFISGDCKAEQNHFDASSKIHKDVRGWTTKQGFEPTYEETEPFLTFIDNYVKHAVGGHYINKYIKTNRNKTLLDKVTASDIAYTILVCENSKEVWDEEIQIKSECKTKEEIKKATRTAKPKYHEGRGKRLKRYEDGWTKEGVAYFRDMCVAFKNLKNHHLWNHLQVHWSTYMKRYYDTNYIAQDEPTSEFDNEEERISDEQWAIEIDETESQEAPALDVSIDIDNDNAHVDKRARHEINYFEA